jgi:TATA-box binding protein (TBP) (component of TFIID and TFIIIB)
MIRKKWNQLTEEEIIERCMDSIEETNLVATGGLKAQRVDVWKLARHNHAVNFRVHAFAASKMKLKSPQATFSVYPTGRISCMGADSYSKVCLATVKTIYATTCMMKRNGVFSRDELDDFVLRHMFVNNMVSTMMTFPINLALLKQLWPHLVVYTPQQPDGSGFPGASLKCKLIPGMPINTNIVMLIFGTGKINVTGSHSHEETIKVCRAVLELVLMQVRITDDSVRLEEPPVTIDTSVFSGEPFVTYARTQKRKRGRPRKVAVEFDDNSSDSDADIPEGIGNGTGKYYEDYFMDQQQEDEVAAALFNITQAANRFS